MSKTSQPRVSVSLPLSGGWLSVSGVNVFAGPGDIFGGRVESAPSVQTCSDSTKSADYISGRWAHTNTASDAVCLGSSRTTRSAKLGKNDCRRERRCRQKAEPPHAPTLSSSIGALAGASIEQVLAGISDPGAATPSPIQDAAPPSDTAHSTCGCDHRHRFGFAWSIGKRRAPRSAT